MADKKIKEAQRLYYEVKLGFRKISEILKITLAQAIHYCLDLKYKL